VNSNVIPGRRSFTRITKKSSPGGGHVVPRSHNRCRDAPLWYTRY
jgi:hypothetical protein